MKAERKEFIDVLLSEVDDLIIGGHMVNMVILSFSLSHIIHTQVKLAEDLFLDNPPLRVQ